MMKEKIDGSRQWCYGCGENNPEGLRVEFSMQGKQAIGNFTPRDVHQGYPGVAHGGVIASVLDEAMGWAMYASGTWGITAKMEVRYRGSLHPGQRVTVSGEVVDTRGRWMEAVSKISDSDGEVLAEAKGTFSRLSDEKAKQLEAFYLALDGTGDR